MDTIRASPRENTVGCDNIGKSFTDEVIIVCRYLISDSWPLSTMDSPYTSLMLLDLARTAVASLSVGTAKR
ncbi:hypothetical protein D3C72_2506320 [compost metagenome]